MDRKEIVKRLSDKLGIKAKYLGPPSFGYEIRTEEETYIIDRYGAITNSEGRIIILDEILNPSESTEEENEEIAVIIAKGEDVLPIGGLEIKLPIGNHTGRTLQNIINMLSSKQQLIMMAFETSEAFMDKDLAKDLSEKEVNTIEDIKLDFHELGSERCPGLTFNFEEGTFTVKLAADNLTPEKISAFQQLIVSIDESARKQMRASFKPSQDDNPKYAMRTWLIRLGMNGKEYKDIRKTLLSSLEGSGAFRRVSDEEEQANG